MSQLKLEVDVKNKITDKLAAQLGDWTCLYPFFEGPEWVRLKNSLKPDIAQTTPEVDKWFRAFTLCKFADLKVVFMGLCPYHTIDSHYQKPVADGLAFSTDYKHAVPPSLYRVYKGIEADLWDRMNLNMQRYNDLEFLAKQGVLLTNVSLTTIFGTAGYHERVWAPFAKFLIKTLNEVSKDIIFVGFGNVACEVLQLVDKNKHQLVELEHPAFAAREHRDWKHEKVFSRINDELERQGKTPIEWDKYLTELEPAPF